MSIQVGIGITEVVLTRDGWYGGKTSEALLQTAEQMMAEGAHMPAIDAVRAVAEGGTPATTEGTEQVYLFGDYRPIQGADKAHKAVLYAEAAQKGVGGGFSLVRVALWMGESVRGRRPLTVADGLLHMCLRHAAVIGKGYEKAIPITDRTIVRPLPSRDDFIVPFVVGHKEATNGLHNLDLPHDLIARLQNTVNEYYSTQLGQIR